MYIIGNNKKKGNRDILDVGCWMLDFRCWMIDVGCWMLDFGC
jgi:hypothetical protein